jgi:antitoxin HigA-1
MIPRRGAFGAPPQGGATSGAAKPDPRQPLGGVRAGVNGVRQRLPLHPGRFLERHYLRPLALTQTEVARRLGVSRRRINELVLGKRAMSPDTAIRCAQAFGLPAATWLGMQSDWDAFHAWKSLRRAQGAGR